MPQLVKYCCQKLVSLTLAHVKQMKSLARVIYNSITEIDCYMHEP